jgi:peptide deformylase
MFVTDVIDDGGPRVYVNPTVTLLPGPRGVHEEGCLSLPGLRVDIERPQTASIAATGLDGQPINRISDQFVARVWQHEFDHINGVMIIDKMSTLDRLATRKLLKELESAARPVKF